MDENKAESGREETLASSHGEYTIPRRGWLAQLEEEISFAYIHIIDGRRCTTAFAAPLLIFSFAQVFAVIYDGYLGLAPEVAESSPFINSFLLCLRVITIARVYHSSYVFFIFTYAMFAVLLLHIVLVYIIAVSRPPSLGRPGAVIEVANVTMHVLYWALAIPIANAFLTFCDCLNVSAKIDVTCGSFAYCAHLVAISLLFSLFILVLLTISVYGFTADPYGADAFARYPWSFEPVYLMARICIVAIATFFVDAKYHWAMYAFTAILCVALVTYFFYYIPYYNRVMSVSFCAAALGLSWTVVCLFAGDTLRTFNVPRDRSSFAVAVGLVVLTFVAYYLRRYIVRRALLWEKYVEIENEARFNLIMEEFAKLIITPTETLDSYDFLLRQGFIMVHRRECDNPICPLSNPSELYLPMWGRTTQPGTNLEDPVRLWLLVVRMYRVSEAKALLDERQENKDRRAEYMNKSAIHRGAPTCLALAYYLIHHIGNLQAAASQIALAEGITKDKILTRHAIRAAKLQLVRATEERNARSNEPDMRLREEEEDKNHEQLMGTATVQKRAEELIDPRKMLIYEENFRHFEIQLALMIRRHLEFWRELGSERPDLQSLNDRGIVILETRPLIDQAWQALKDMNRFYPPCDVLYGRYLKLILGLREEGEKYLTVEGGGEMRKSVVGETMSTMELMFHAPSVVLVMSAMRSSKSLILKASNNITAIFGFAKTEIVGQRVEAVIPEFYGQFHEQFVQRYNDTGRKRVLEKMVATFGMHKNGFLLPVNLLVKNYYDLHYQSVFTGFITPSIFGNEYIITNHLGLIVGTTEGASEDFGGMTPLMLSESEIFIYYFCPEMLIRPNSLEEDYAKITGFTRYKCMIPRNTNSLNSFVQTRLGFVSPKDAEHKEKDGDGTARLEQRNKFVKQNSARRLAEGSYKAKYKDCDEKAMEFSIENYDYPELNLHLKIFAYKRNSVKVLSDNIVSRGASGTRCRIQHEFASVITTGNISTVLAPHGEPKLNSPPKSAKSAKRRTSKLRERMKKLRNRNSSFAKLFKGEDDSSDASNTKSLDEGKPHQNLPETRTLDRDRKPLRLELEENKAGENELRLSLHNPLPMEKLDREEARPLGNGAAMESNENLSKFSALEQSSRVNLVVPKKQVEEGQPNVAKKSQSTLQIGGDAASGNEKVVNELKRLRSCTSDKYNPSLILYMNLTLTASVLATLGLVIAGFVLETTSNSNIHDFVNIHTVTRFYSVLSIAESSRSLILMSPKNLFGKSVISSRNRSALYDYGTLASGYTGSLTYSELKQYNLLAAANDLLKVEEELLRMNKQLPQKDVLDVISPVDTETVYSLMRSEITNESGLIHTAICLYADQAYRLYNYGVRTIDEFSYTPSFLIKNGLYLLTIKVQGVTLALGNAITKTIESRSFTALIFFCLLSGLCTFTVLLFSIIIYRIKRKKSEFLRLLLSIKKIRIVYQARLCSGFYRSGNTEGTHEAGNEENHVGEQPAEAADETSVLVPEGEREDEEDPDQHYRNRRNFKDYVGKVKQNVAKVLVIMLIQLGYFLQDYLVPNNSFNYVTKNTDEFYRISNVTKTMFEAYAYMIEMIGTNSTTTVDGVAIPRYLKTKLSGLVDAMKTIEENHALYKKYFTQDYNYYYSQIMETSLCFDITNATTKAECTSLLGGVLDKGLILASTAYVNLLEELLRDYMTLMLSGKLTVTGIKTLLNDTRIITSEIVKEKYIGPYNFKLLDSSSASANKIISDLQTLSTVLFALFLLYLAICYVILMRLVLSKIKRDMFSTYSLFGILPTELILQTPIIKNYLLKSFADMNSNT